MLNIPAAIIDAARTPGSIPSLFLDIETEISQKGEIRRRSQWIGADDPRVSADSNVDFDRKPGSVVLAPNTAVASPLYGGSPTFESSMSYGITRTDIYTSHVGWFTITYSHTSTTITVTNEPPPTIIRWTANVTQRLDTLLLFGNYSGPNQISCNVQIFQSDGTAVSNNIVWNPSGVTSQHTLSGFNASITSGVGYYLRITAIQPTAPGPIRVPGTRAYTWTINLYSYTVADTNWRIAYGSGFISTGGQSLFKTTGNLTRQMDVGAIPSASGAVTFSDVIPAGTTMTVQLYWNDDTWTTGEAYTTANRENHRRKYWHCILAHTASATTEPEVGVDWATYWAEDTTMTGWTALGALSSSGDALDAHRYWRALISMTSNAAQDLTPEMLILSVDYAGKTLSIGSKAEIEQIGTEIVQKAYKGLLSASTSTAQLSPQVQESMIGRWTADLGDEPIVQTLLTRLLRGRTVRLRAGYHGVTETIELHGGVVEDMSFENLRHKLMAKDDLELSDVRIPAERSGAGWASITFANGTHLADIIKDMLRNRINIPDEKIDLASIDAVKAALPNRTTTGRVLTKPTAVKGMLQELAWLLESQFVVRDGQIALIQEPPEGTPAAAVIEPRENVVNSVKYRRGWKELTNQALCLNSYSGDGEGEEQFTSGEIISDTTSISDYQTTVMKTYQDKWGISATELQSRLSKSLANYKDGRRVIECVIPMMHMAIEPGDPIIVKSGQFPKSDPGPFLVMVLRKDMNWQQQKLSITGVELPYYGRAFDSGFDTGFS